MNWRATYERWEAVYQKGAPDKLVTETFEYERLVELLRFLDEEFDGEDFAYIRLEYLDEFEPDAEEMGYALMWEADRRPPAVQPDPEDPDNLGKSRVAIESSQRPPLQTFLYGRIVNGESGMLKLRIGTQTTWIDEARVITFHPDHL